jgi:hypothetical protein
VAGRERFDRFIFMQDPPQLTTKHSKNASKRENREELGANEHTSLVRRPTVVVSSNRQSENEANS